MRSPRPIVSTLRLQLQPGFSFDDAAGIVDHVAALGVSHLYLSPILQATDGSTHGYDVVDHSRIAAGLGGEAGFARLVSAAHGAGLGIVVDVVPNHMTTPTPSSLNAPLWSVLREGRASAFESWFDIDWDVHDGKVLWPVLGSSLEDVLAAGELTLDRVDGEDVLRYFEHLLPLAPGSDVGRMPLSSLLESQHYRLASWRTAADELNYRRFFDVTSLIAVRVEEPAVFDATHQLIVDLVRSGDIDGLRIDHPDGLADPAGYLDRLATATEGAWVVVEKILEGDEQLPAHWASAGTTGYDALLRVGGLFVDPAGEAALTALSGELLGEQQDLDEMINKAKRFVVEHVQTAELNRLMRLVERVLPHEDHASLRRGLEALLVSMDRYRAYVDPGAEMSQDAARALSRAEAVAVEAVDGADEEAVAVIAELARGGRLPQAQVDSGPAAREFVVRFQQTCGPVMAKAIEDTAFYRFVRLTGLNEVGGDPGHIGIGVADFHDFAAGLGARWPQTMTTLSTHDTKRSEDVRARLAVLAERPGEWRNWVLRAGELGAAHRSEDVDALTEYLLWQTLVGAWPIDVERLGAYATKAIREAKLHTSWTEVNESYEAAIADFATGITTDPAIAGHVADWLSATETEERANVLGQKVIQLLMPGIPDVYQGTDLLDLSLVDPDNRRLVDHAERRRRLERLDAGEPPQDLADEKLLVTIAALRVRRERSEAFIGEAADYRPLEADSEHAIAFARGSSPDVVVLATRLAGTLALGGGWKDVTVSLPAGLWLDRLSGRLIGGGDARLVDLLPPDGLPVALLARAPEPS